MSFPLRPYTLIHGGSLELLVSPPPFVGIVHHLHTHFVEMGGPRLAGGGPSYPPLLNSRPSLESPLSVHLFVIQTTIFWASLLCLPVVGDSETKWCLGNKGVLLLCCARPPNWKASLSPPSVCGMQLVIVVSLSSSLMHQRR